MDLTKSTELFNIKTKIGGDIINGIPDRIDIDDNRNEVQDVSDLSLVGNRTSKSSKKDKDAIHKVL